MNKSDLYYKLAEAQGIPVEESTKVVDAFFKAKIDNSGTDAYTGRMK